MTEVMEVTVSLPGGQLGDNLQEIQEENVVVQRSVGIFF
jgi:hypothetical protein